MLAKNEPSRTSRFLAFAGLLIAFGMTGLAVANSPANSARADENAEVAGGGAPHPTDSLEPIERVAPRWPREALSRGITGEVTLVGTVKPDGGVSDVEVIHSQPEGVFDEAALEAFSQWRFRPTTTAGEPATPEDRAPRRVEQTIIFELNPGNGN